MKATLIQINEGTINFKEVNELPSNTNFLFLTIEQQISAKTGKITGLKGDILFTRGETKQKIGSVTTKSKNLEILLGKVAEFVQKHWFKETK